MDEREKAACEMGYDLTVIKTYVSEIMDRSLQQKLRDKQRNINFHNMVRDGDSNLVYESEDVIFVMEESGRVINWFFKQEREKLTAGEWASL